MEAASYNVPRGAALISMQHLLHYGFSFVFYVAVARILTQEQIGQVSLLMFLLTTFSALTQLSLPVAATKFISENLGRGDVKQAGAVARTTLKLLLMISVPALLVSYLISPYLSTSFFQSPELTVPVILTFTASFILDLTTLYGAQLLGLGRYFRMVLQNMIYIRSAGCWVCC